MKKISIITINYNNCKGLERTMSGVLTQLVPEVEYVIIDGGSEDGSRDFIAQHSSQLSYWVSEKDKGIYHAQNKGIANATGEYCLFLNSGDELASVEILKKVLPQLSGEDIIYGNLITRGKNSREELHISPEIPDEVHFMVSTLWHPVAFIKRGLFTRLGLYNEEFKITGDYEFFIRALLRYHSSSKHISLPIAVFQTDGLSNDPNNEQLQLEERERSWQLNFSEEQIESFKELTQYQRSSRYKWVRTLKKWMKPLRPGK